MIEVQVEKIPEMAEDNAFDVAAEEKKIVAGLKSMLGIKVEVKVKVVEPKAITRSKGKAVRVIDKRDLYK